VNGLSVALAIKRQVLVMTDADCAGFCWHCHS
jgi:hypothetical protein